MDSEMTAYSVSPVQFLGVARFTASGLQAAAEQQPLSVLQDPVLQHMMPAQRPS